VFQIPYIPESIIADIKQIDLLTYKQNYDPGDLFKRGNEYRLHSHGSLVISNGKWHWKSRDVGGASALDYLIKVEGMAFLEAANHLLNHTTISTPIHAKIANQPKEKHLILPSQDADLDKAIRYLMKRGISRNVIKFCIDAGVLYQSTRHTPHGSFPNVVFIGFDRDREARFACIRGLDDSNRFYGDAPGSDKRFSFSITAAHDDRKLHIFESAIDVLSYATLMEMKGRDWHNTNYLSLSGIYRPSINNSSKPQALDQYLSDHPHIKAFALHLDNDEPGRAASDAIMNRFRSQYSIENHPSPTGKDYNDYLCGRLDLPPQQQRERAKERNCITR